MIYGSLRCLSKPDAGLIKSYEHAEVCRLLLETLVVSSYIGNISERRGTLCLLVGFFRKANLVRGSAVGDPKGEGLD